MIKRAIAVTAGLCMIYGSAMIPQAEPEVITNLQQIATLEPIKPVPVKEKYEQITISENKNQPNQEGHSSTAGETEAVEVSDGDFTDELGNTEQLGSEAQDQQNGTGINGDAEGLGQLEQSDIGSDGGTEGGEYLEGVEPYQEPTVQEEVTADYLGTWTITAYCGCEQCCGEWGNATASGAYPIAGHTIACNILPFGTQLMIDGIVYTVEDTGYTEYGDYWIDIYFSTHQEALNYGVQEHEVYMIY